MALKIVVLLKILQMVLSHPDIGSKSVMKRTAVVDPIVDIDNEKFPAACYSKNGALIGNECFIISEVGDELSWQGAVEKCSQKYGPLASPANPLHFYHFVSSIDGDIPFWVGGYSPPNAKSFRWLNDTQIPVNFPWAHGEPSPANPPSDQRCMQVNYGGGYANQPCANEQRYICKLDACGMLGGITLGYQCLAFKEDQLTWGKATEKCASEGGRLVVPAYPQLLIDYTFDHFDLSGSERFWVGGLQIDFSNEDSWYWLNGQPIPLGDINFPWVKGQPDNYGSIEHCLDVWLLSDNKGYNDEHCNDTKRFICELETSKTTLPSPVHFVVPQISSGKYIGPKNVFPYIQDNDDITLHFTLDPNMQMTFDIVDGMWGYIRHVISGKIVTPLDNGDDTTPMNPKDGTPVVLHSDRRPWALFALDQYQNRIIHRSGKFISSQGRDVIITGDESKNQTMEFQFMNPNNPDKEVMPYGHPVISGDWQLVFSVLNSISTHTYSAKVTIGRSDSLSSSHSFKFGFEVAKSKRTSNSSSSSSYGFGFGSSSSYGYDSSSIHSHGCSGWPWSRTCTSLSFNSGSGHSFGTAHGHGSSSRHTSSSSSGTATTDSLSAEIQQASSDTWSSESTRDISFTVEAGQSVAIWQRSFIAEHMGHRAVHLSNTFTDTDSSRINPNNFDSPRRRLPFDN